MLHGTEFVMFRGTDPEEHEDRIGRPMFFYKADVDQPLREEFGCLSVPESVYAEMGSPDAITVRVRPGDHLNDGLELFSELND